MDRLRACYLIALVAAFCVGAPSAARAARPTPPVAALGDVADWRAAKLGRAALPLEADEKNAILVVTGGAVATSLDAKQAALLADAAGIDVLNLAQRDLPADPASLAGTKAKFVSASFSVPGAPWTPHVL